MNINIQKKYIHTIHCINIYISWIHIYYVYIFHMNYYHNTNGFRQKFMIIIKFLTNKMHNINTPTTCETIKPHENEIYKYIFSV